MKPPPRERSLLIGVGNPFRGDDAAGVCVAQALQLRLGDAVEIRDASCDALSLIEMWSGRAEVRVVDAIHCETLTAGAIVTLDVADDGPLSSGFSSSTHTLDLGQAIDLARVLGRLPARLTLHGIVGASFAPGQDLSPQVAAAVAHLTDALADRFATTGGL